MAIIVEWRQINIGIFIILNLPWNDGKLLQYDSKLSRYFNPRNNKVFYHGNLPWYCGMFITLSPAYAIKLFTVVKKKVKVMEQRIIKYFVNFILYNMSHYLLISFFLSLSLFKTITIFSLYMSFSAFSLFLSHYTFLSL